jgi:uncharacterized damage-inducible protein DinB
MSMIDAFAHEFRKHREMMEQSIGILSDEEFFRRPGEQVNSVGLIVKHMAGNLLSRWTDFLTSDGEKPSRDRDDEFVLSEADTRQQLLAKWNTAWVAVEKTLAELTEADLSREVTIYGRPHTVLLALLRGLDHAAYHAGQIAYLARLYQPNARWLTIPPGKSKEFVAAAFAATKR